MAMELASSVSETLSAALQEHRCIQIQGAAVSSLNQPLMMVAEVDFSM
jgi:hypothetical protein